MAKEISRLQTIAFFGTVGASTGKTLVSKRIERPFKIKEIAASFAPGVNRLMNLEFYISPDDSEPTAKPLTGTNILASLGHVGYITGDDERKEMKTEVEMHEGGYYLKVFADNSDTYEHTIDAQITIELFYEVPE
jgi:hypothetical protein